MPAAAPTRSDECSRGWRKWLAVPLSFGTYTERGTDPSNQREESLDAMPGLS
jgi:hypothetical protein